jgi:hypothetical protein
MPREPWIKVKIGIRRSGKLAGLVNDSARYGWVLVLVESKVQRRMGTFDNRAHFVEVMGRYGRFLDDYVGQTLLEIAPALCDECRRRNRGLKAGQLVVHDYLREQRDATNADRQAAYRERHQGDEDEPEDPPRNGDHNGIRNGDRNAVGDSTVTGDSRARATTATGTGTTLSSGRGSSSQIPPASTERADVQALLDHGFKRVTAKQRRVLDEVLGRHDLTGPEFAAEAIRATPADADPLAAVMDADRRWQAAQRARADAEEAGWAGTKVEERNGTGNLGPILRRAVASSPSWMPGDEPDEAPDDPLPAFLAAETRR